MSGVSCIHWNNTTDESVYSESIAGDCPSNELYAIKILHIILISILCLYIFFTFDKCKRARKLCKIRKNAEFANESILFTNKEHNDKYHEIENYIHDEPSINVYWDCC